jgi:hypothetical protein
MVYQQNLKHIWRKKIGNGMQATSEAIRRIGRFLLIISAKVTTQIFCTASQ